MVESEAWPTNWSGAWRPRSAATSCIRRTIPSSSAASTRWSGGARRRPADTSSSGSSATKSSSTPSGSPGGGAGRLRPRHARARDREDHHPPRASRARTCAHLRLPDRKTTLPLAKRLQQKGVTRIVSGGGRSKRKRDQAGIVAARKIYGTAVETAEKLWQAAKAGEKPDPGAARKIIDSLAKAGRRPDVAAGADRAEKYDNYTFTHMVNVSVLAMAQARSLNMEGTLLREFGFAALMHDIGKVETPQEVLNNPGKLSKEEFDIMQRHVVDGAHILRRTPEMPALAPIVAFEHHLRQDLSGYPAKIGHRKLNLCTQIVSIADVYDALRSNRSIVKGWRATGSSHHGQKGRPGVQPAAAAAVHQPDRHVSGRHAGAAQYRARSAWSPRAPVRSVPAAGEDRARQGRARTGRIDAREHVGTGRRGEITWAVVEAVDPEAVDIDPLKYRDGELTDAASARRTRWRGSGVRARLQGGAARGVALSGRPSRDRADARPARRS